MNIPFCPILLSHLPTEWSHGKEETLSVAILRNSMECTVLVLSILQLFQGLVVDGVHPVVDKAAAQEHGQGKDPRVILGVP